METSVLFGILTLLSLWYNLWVSISIVNYLKSRGKEVSLFKYGFYIKGKIFHYLPLYKETTLEESGKLGGLYYQFYLSFILVFAFFFLGLLSLKAIS